MATQNLFGKVIWLTGASSGIGKALALELNSQGAKLILSARNRDALYAVKTECTFNPIDVHILPLDVTDMEEIPRIAQEATRIYGKIDWLIHNAGISQRSYAEVTELKVDRKIMEVNYFGPVAITKAVLPDMIKRRSGNIAVVSSLVGKFGTPYRSGYAASKHALHGFFESLRAETEDRGVKVTMVCPGFIQTELTLNALTGNGAPLNKIDEAQKNGMPTKEFAIKMVKALKKEKREVYIGGKEKLGVYLKRFFPSILAAKIKNAKVR